MAARNNKITLNLDFNVEKSKLQEIGSIINKETSKAFNSSKGSKYYENIENAIKSATKEASGLYAQLNKPLGSKKEAADLGKSLEKVFDGMNMKVTSLQGNISRTLKSMSNTQALTQLKQVNKELDDLKGAYKTISSLNAEFKNLGNQKVLSSQLKTATKEMESLKNKSTALTKEEKDRQSELQGIISSTNEKLQRKLDIQEQIAALQKETATNTQVELDAKIKEKTDERDVLAEGTLSPKEGESLKGLLKDLTNLLKDLSKAAETSTKNIVNDYDEQEDALRRLEEAEKSVGDVLRGLGIPLLTLNEVARGIREVISYSYDYIKNLDAALTEIAVVSGKTRQEVMALTDTFIELSAATGMAVDDIAQASTIFYQQGLGDDAVKKLTEYTALFAKISGEDVPTAADQITAAMHGFNYSYEQVEEIVDKMSVLAAKSAADIDELATAMSKGASQANVAGLSFDQYNAYLATMIETTREAPENLGTSLKTIMSRFQQIKTGDNTEDDTDVNAVEKALKTVNVALRDTDGQLRDLGDVLNDLGPKWKSLDRNTQVYLGTVIAGTRQQSRFMSLMQNWDRALELTEASEKSAGAATKMHQSAMEGLDASLNNLTNSWQKLISSLANGDTFKGLIDGLTKIVSWFAEGDSMLKILTTAFTAYNAITLIHNARLAAAGKEYKNLNTAVKTVKSLFVSTKTSLGELSNEFSQSTTKIQEETAALNQNAQAWLNRKAAQKAGSGGDVSGTPKLNGKKVVSPEKADPALIDKATEGIKKVGKESSNAGGKLSTLGGKMKTFAGNATQLVGSISLAINAALIAVSAVEWVADKLTTTGDEIIEKAQKAYDSVQKEIDKRTELISAVEDNVQVYTELSKKMNKSAEETQKLANAAKALGDAAPGAILGYDSNGNPIIDTNAATSKASEVERELVEYGKEQIANIGDLARGELKKKAEENFAASGAGKANKAAQTGGKVAVAAGAGGVAAAGGAMVAAGTAADATVVGLPAGLVMQIAGGLLVLGAAIFGGAKAAEGAAVSQEEYNLALEKAAKISDENSAALLQNMSYITNANIANRDFQGVSEKDRTSIAAGMQKNFLDDRTGDLLNQLATKKISEKEYEKQFKQLGSEWEKIIQKVGDSGLAQLSKGLDDIQKDVGKKTYGQVEKEIDDLLGKMNINPDTQKELYNTIKETLMNAAYDGLDYGVDDVVNELEARKSANPDKAESYDKAINSAKNNLTSDQLNFYKSSGILDNVDLFNKFVSEYQESINSALVVSTEEASVTAMGILQEYSDQARARADAIAAQAGGVENLKGTLKAEYDFYIQQSQEAVNTIEGIWGSLEMATDIPWKTLWENFDKTTEKARTAYETLAKLKEGEGIDLSQWKAFTQIFDEIDFSHMNGDQLTQYANALDTIGNNLKVVNGQLYTNKEATQAVATLEAQMAEMQLQETRAKLIAKRTELEAQKAIMDAQVATLKYAIAAAEGQVDAEDSKIKAQDEWSKAAAKIDKVFIENNAVVAQSMVTQYADAFGKIGDKYNKLVTAISTGKIVDSEGIRAQTEAIRNDMTKNLNFDSYYDSIKGSNLSDLKKQLQAAQNASDAYGLQIKNIDLKLKTLNLGLNTTFNGIANGTDKAKKAADAYIGKLQEIYNVLNKIETIEHRLGVLEKYNNITIGKQYAEIMKQRLALTKTNMDYYKKSIEMRKDLVASEQKAITDSPVGNVFSFDQYGTIIIDYEKYLKLQDQAIDGEMTQKELADKLYDEYKDFYGSLQSDMDGYVDQLQKIIDLEQQQVDTYIDLEHDLANAVKDIYQEMLDTKLDAIDKEIDALDKLREARKRSNEDNKNSKELSKMQTSLNRALMDTSGASNVKQLDYRDQIQSKLEDMGETAYERKMDDIQKTLEDQKDMLQKEFDEFFKDWSKLYEMIDNRIMGNKDAVVEVLKSTDEYKHALPVERAKLVQEWGTKYETATADIGAGATIMDVFNNITELKSTVAGLDQVLMTHGDVDRIGKEVSTALTEFYQSLDKGNSGGSGSGAGSSGGSSGGYTPPTTDTESPADEIVEANVTLDEFNNKLEETKGGIKTWWENVKSAVANFFTQTLPDFIAHIPENLGKLIAEIFNFFFDYLPGFFGKVKEAIENFVASIPGLLISLGVWLGEKALAIHTWLTETMPNAVAEFLTVTIPEKWNEFWTWVGTSLENLWNGIVDWFRRLGESIWNNLTDTTKEKLSAIGTWIYEKFEAFKDAITGVKDWIGDRLQDVSDKFTEIFTAIGSWISEKIDGFKNIISEAWTFLKNGASDAWEGIKSVFGRIPEWFKEKFGAAWQHVVDIFSAGGKMFDNIKDGIVNAVKGVINKLRDGFNWVIKQPFDWLNGILNTIRNIEFLNISPFKGLWKENPIGVPQIPAFKKGGFIDFTGPAWVDGTRSAPEAVLNAAQTKAFMNIADNLDKLDAITQTPAGASVQIQSIEFRVDSMSSPEDGERAFDAFVQKFNDIGRRTGIALTATQKV